MDRSDAPNLKKKTLSLGVTAFALLIACLLLIGQAVFELKARSTSHGGGGGDELTLRSRATPSDSSSSFGNASAVVVIVVAGFVAILIIANAVAEASGDSALAVVKKGMGRERADHLYLPVQIRTSGAPDAEGHLLSLGRRRAVFIASKNLPHGQAVMLHSNAMPNSDGSSTWFHGVVVGSRGDESTGTFEIESRLHATSSEEEHELVRWISSLCPHASPS